MKLHEEFKKLVTSSRHGELLQAWFTSFELSLTFVEKYILPLFSDNPDLVPSSIRDYEAVQHDINNKGADIRFFCDSRYYIPDVKRTSVKIYGLPVYKFEKQFTGGVFHPKIILLRFQKASFIIAGSANLTLSGWARNIEAVTGEEIKSSRNVRKITNFFKQISAPLESSEFASAIEKMEEWSESLVERDEGWVFASSFDNESFPEKLLQGRNCGELVIWSPYFSRDVISFCDNHLFRRMKEGANITIVPDVNAENKIRIDTKLEPELNSRDDIIIRTDSETFPESKVLVHAKIWITPSQIAVGSWNMTEAGTGCSDKYANNIEAGIIKDIENSIYKEMTKRLRDEFKPGFMEQGEIEKEKPEPVHEEIFCMVMADWKKREYTIIRDGSLDNYLIKLPGFEKISIRNAFGKEGKRDFTGQRKELVKDRYFHLFMPDSNEKVFTGMFIENHPERRPVDEFESLRDLMYGWLWSQPEDSVESHVPIISHGPGNGNVDDSDNVLAVRDQNQISWFVMFMALGNIKRRLESALQNAKDRPQALDDILTVLPGSVIELMEKMKPLLDDPSTEKARKWFVLQELISILSPVREMPFFKESFLEENFLEYGHVLKQIYFESENDRTWAEEVRRICNYMD